MVNRKCATCDYYGRYEVVDHEGDLLDVENWDRNWDGCKLKREPSSCMIQVDVEE
jgi:hypothetical protein